MFVVWFVVLSCINLVSGSGENVRISEEGSQAEIKTRTDQHTKMIQETTSFRLSWDWKRELLSPEYEEFRLLLGKAFDLWGRVLIYTRPIVVKVDIAGTGHGWLSAGSAFLDGLWGWMSWEKAVTYLQKVDPDPWANFPPSAAVMNETLNVASGTYWDGWGVYLPPPLMSDYYNSTPHFHLSVETWRISEYDLEPQDGTSIDKYDALTDLLRGIGTGLGFLTWPNSVDDTVLSARVLDFFRFSSPLPENLTVAQRQFDPNAQHFYFKSFHDESAVEWSPVGPNPSAFEKYATWKDGVNSDILGVMDETLEKGMPVGISPYDIAALDSMGYVVQKSIEPVLDGFDGLDQTTLKIKVLSFFVWKGSYCAFNNQDEEEKEGTTTITVRSDDDLRKNAWRGVTCSIPSKFKIGVEDIWVSLSDDGTKFSDSIQFSWSTIRIDSVSPSIISLMKPNETMTTITTTVTVKGRLFSLDQKINYKCCVNGLKFGGTVISNQDLVCDLTFSSSFPEEFKGYEFTVSQGKVESNHLTVSFLYPPVITSAKVEGNQVKLKGNGFEEGVCEFSTGQSTRSFLKSKGLKCETVAFSTETVEVRVSSRSGWSNWVTLHVAE